MQVVLLWNCYLCVGKELTLHFEIIGIKAASIKVVNYFVWFVAVDVVLVLPTYKKSLVWEKNILARELSESQYLYNVSDVNFGVKKFPCIHKLLRFKLVPP